MSPWLFGSMNQLWKEGRQEERKTEEKKMLTKCNYVNTDSKVTEMAITVVHIST